MKNLNTKHEIFIREMILHGDRTRAYTTAYPNAKKSTAINAAYQLLQHPEIKERINAGQQDITEARLGELKQLHELQLQALKEQVASLNGIRAMIAEIISGEVKTQKAFKMDESIELVELRANVKEVLQSLTLNFKMLKAMGEGSFLHRLSLTANSKPPK